MSERDELACVIWETSRADEGTISATGANIIADKLLADGYSKAELEKCKRGAKTLGEIIEKQCRDMLDVTEMHHVIGEDGDGDWGAVWDHLWTMKAELAKYRAALTYIASPTRMPAPVDTLANCIGHAKDALSNPDGAE